MSTISSSSSSSCSCCSSLTCRPIRGRLRSLAGEGKDKTSSLAAKSINFEAQHNYHDKMITRTPAVIVEEAPLSCGKSKLSEQIVQLNPRKPLTVSRNISKSYKPPSLPVLNLALLLLLLLTLLALITQCFASTLTDFDGATFYKAPVGSRVRIACNGSHWNDDSVSLVLWFKGTVERHSAPIYTIDARQKPLNNGARHFVADNYKGRAKFVAKASPPYLDLAPLEADDQAEYRCRIDYRSRPRENFLIILFVLVPPKSVQITDLAGRSVEQIYGPLSESSDVTLVCLSKGGRPAPALTWLRRRKVIDDSYLTLNDFLALEQSGQLLSGKQRDDRQPQSRPLDLSPQSSPLNSSGSTRPTKRPDDDSNQHANSINAPDPSQLESQWSQWSEWRNWPEYEYFSELAEFKQATFAAFADTDEMKIYSQTESPLIGVGQHEPNAQAAGASRKQVGAEPGGSEQWGQLLSMEVEESITSAANVLKLSNLATLVMPADLVSASPAPPSSNESFRPQLECRASNLHYDLRTLIKLFAPPSLVASRRQVKPQPQQQVKSAGRQLAAAIERTFESLLEAGVNASADATAQGASLAAAALSQIKTDPPAQAQAAPERLALEAAAAQLLQQQLGRPHQLASEAGAPEPGELVLARPVELDIYVRPSELSLRGGQRALSAGQPAEFVCSAVGSRPAARLSWLKNGRPLDAANWRQFDESTGNWSRQTSRLSVQLGAEDHGARLTCRAENEQLSALLNQPAVLEESRVLTVHYAPQLRLELGNKMLSNAIKEASDIYFVCHVDAQPAVREITWMHNERLLGENPLEKSLPFAPSGQAHSDGHSEQNSRPVGPTPIGAEMGLIISNNSLVLQKVKVHQRGKYACLASNSEGLSESNRIELRVLHAPVCAPERTGSASSASDGSELLVERRRVPLGKQARFLCRMEADPADLELSWYLNNSAGERKPLFASALDAGSQANRSAPDLWRPDGSANNDNNNNNQTSRLVARAQKTIQSGHSASSQLNYLVDTHLDYGRLYCVGRNSIGEQKRACVYDIERPDELEPGQAAPQASCLVVNVSAHSVWIACERDKNLAELGPFRFGVELYRSGDSSRELSAGDNYSAEEARPSPQAEAPPVGQLEANLTSGDLEEPLFALNQLRPATRYSARVRHRAESPGALLSFSTSADPLAGPDADADPTPSLGPVAAQEAHKASLLSAFISTRSADAAGQQRLQASYSHNFTASQLHRHQQTLLDQHRPAQPGGLLDSLSAAGSSLLRALHLAPASSGADLAKSSPGALARLHLQTTANGHKRAQQQAAANSRRQSVPLLDTSGAFLLTTICLLLLSLLAVLLLLSRHSGRNCLLFGPKSAASGRMKRRLDGAGSKCSQWAADSPTERQVNAPAENNTEQQSAHDKKAAAEKEPAKAAVRQQASLGNSAAAQIVASSRKGDSKTLDRQVTVARRRASSRTECGEQANGSGACSFELANRVNKSRSSVCLETMLMETGRFNNNNTNREQQQQRLIQLSQLEADECQLIGGDVNLALLNREHSIGQGASGSCYERQCLQCATSNQTDHILAGQYNDEYLSVAADAAEHHYGGSSASSQLAEQPATGYMLCDIQSEQTRDYEAASSIGSFIGPSSGQASSGTRLDGSRSQRAVLNSANGNGNIGASKRQLGARCLDGQTLVPESSTRQMLGFVVMQPESAGYALRVDHRVPGIRQSVSTHEDLQRYLESGVGAANEQHLMETLYPIHPFHAGQTADGQSSSFISDESSDSNAHCTWSLQNNNQADVSYQPSDQLHYIELVPSADCLDSTDPSLISKVVQLGQDTSTVIGDINMSKNNLLFANNQKIDDEQSRVCLSAASPSVGGSSTATNDLAVLSPSSLTNTTTTSHTESILRSNSGCPIAEQDSPPYNDSTVKRNDLLLTSHQSNSHLKSCQLTSILKTSNSNQKQQLDRYTPLDRRQANCLCDANESTSTNPKNNSRL